MCKLLIMTGITDPATAYGFMARMGILMSKRNNDGIGYTAVKSDGSLFSQRWLKNHHFLSTKEVMTKNIAKKLAVYADRLPKDALEVNYSQHGIVDFTDMRTLTLHTRFATCGKEFANTHPFIQGDTSLIHNGSISNAGVLNVNKLSTCDSEAALQTYINNKVNTDMHAAQKWLDELAGRWAFGVISRDENNTRILDVVRGYSMLYYMEIPGVGRVFTTDDDDAKAVVKEMGLEYYITPGLIESNSMYRYDALTGHYLGSPEIKDSAKNYTPPKKTTTEIYHGTTGGTTGKWENGVWTPHSTDTTSDKQDDSQLNMGNGYDTTGVPSEDVYPDIYGADGVTYDYRKVNKYCNDEDGEPLIDRLSIWDEVYETKYCSQYHYLNADQKLEVEKKDFMEGFQAARNLIYQMLKQKKA